MRNIQVKALNLATILRAKIYAATRWRSTMEHLNKSASYMIIIIFIFWPILRFFAMNVFMFELMYFSYLGFHLFLHFS